MCVEISWNIIASSPNYIRKVTKIYVEVHKIYLQVYQTICRGSSKHTKSSTKYILTQIYAEFHQIIRIHSPKYMYKFTIIYVYLGEFTEIYVYVNQTIKTNSPKYMYTLYICTSSPIYI